MATQADARNKVVESNINLTTGTLTSVTDPNGQTVQYTYDTLKRVTGVQATAGGKTYKNAYVYTDDKLTQVSHNTGSNSVCDVQYNFEYVTARYGVSAAVVPLDLDAVPGEPVVQRLRRAGRGKVQRNDGGAYAIARRELALYGGQRSLAARYQHEPPAAAGKLRRKRAADAHGRAGDEHGPLHKGYLLFRSLNG